MQTFLPYPDFKQSAQCLDRLRLGRQRVECLQILFAVLTGESQWVTHPAVKIWFDYYFALYTYGQAICEEWSGRGYKDTCAQKMRDLVIKHGSLYGPLILPHWFGDQQFHDAHKSNLLRKDYKHYSQFNWDVPTDLPYIWPRGGSIF